MSNASVVPTGEWYVDSLYAINQDRNSPTFNFDPIENITGIRLLEAQINFTYYIIHSLNKTFYLRDDGVTFTLATLLEGNYTATTICTELKRALEAASLTTATYTVTYSERTGKLTIVNNKADLALNFVADTDLQAGLWLGWPPGTYTGTASAGPVSTLEANGVLRITGPDYLLLCGKMGNIGSNVFNGNSTRGGLVLARIPVDCAPNGVIFFKNESGDTFKYDGSLSEANFFFTMGTNAVPAPLNFNGGGFSLKWGLTFQTQSERTGSGGGGGVVEFTRDNLMDPSIMKWARG